MNLTRAALVAHAKSDAGRRAVRYSCTSIICVGITQVLLFLFSRPFGWRPTVANITAVMITAIPALYLNKHWVWGKRGKAHVRREVIPFAVFTLAGWILSTLMVAAANDWTQDMSENAHQLAIQAASVGGFGILWVLKYLFLDKVMFGPHHHTPYDEDIEAEEARAKAGRRRRQPAAASASAAPPTS